jgi:hypothetical protein
MHGMPLIMIARWVMKSILERSSFTNCWRSFSVAGPCTVFIINMFLLLFLYLSTLFHSLPFSSILFHSLPFSSTFFHFLPLSSALVSSYSLKLHTCNQRILLTEIFQRDVTPLFAELCEMLVEVRNVFFCTACIYYNVSFVVSNR